MPEKKASNEVVLCTCGHEHARGEKCGAVVSGVPMLTYCACPGALKPGEHLGQNPTS
jgi:hypothetical protein